MKAFVLHNIGDITLDEINQPNISSDEVLVKVKAVGVCGSDIPRIYTTGAYKHPLVPGHEFSGQVIKIGENVEGNWLNKRVGVFPIIPCMECQSCKNKHYEMCKNYSYLGSRQDGGFAEYVSVPVSNLIGLPDNVNYLQAAMLEPMAVAIHAIRKAFQIDDVEAQSDKSKNICICGLGTIGLLIYMFLQELGFENIYLVGNKTTQRDIALSFGLNESNFCDTNKVVSSEWLLQATNNLGVDIFFECVGKNDTISLAVQSAAPLGKILLVGNPHSNFELEKSVYWKILRNQLTLIGTWNSSFSREINDDWNFVINLLKNERVKPEKLITHTFNLNELETGFLIMRDKLEEYIKIMCNMN